jgi:hypothetical protein
VDPANPIVPVLRSGNDLTGDNEEPSGTARRTFGTHIGWAAGRRAWMPPRASLRNDLGFTDQQIIDVPVILGAEAGAAIALSGDSVNLLQVTGAAQATVWCLPSHSDRATQEPMFLKPTWLTNSTGWVVNHPFAINDKIHVQEGEIHCGTNQVHTALAGARVRWWDVQPPP